MSDQAAPTPLIEVLPEQMERLSSHFRLGEFLDIMRRQWPVIVAAVVLCNMLAVLYVVTAKPVFTGTAQVMIDMRRSRFFETQRVVGDLTADSGTVDSQVELIRSETVAMNAARNLKLTDDPEFMAGETGLMSGLISAITGPITALFATQDESGEAPPPDNALRDAAQLIQQYLQVRRIGSSYVIEISYLSRSPARAAQIANGVAEAYISGELEAKYAATRKAIVWLQDRLQELRNQATQADARLQRYRFENNLIETGRGPIDEQQITDLSSQLGAARALKADAKARLDRAQSIISSGIPDATVSEALKSETIIRLRSQYLDLSSREADVTRRVGTMHEAAVSLRAQMAQLRLSITEELRRIAESARSDYEVALSREKSLEKDLSVAVASSAGSAGAQVRLRELDSTAQVHRALADTFQQRFVEANQQQSFPISEARVITAAAEPSERTSPKAGRALLASLGAGIFLGAAAGLLREKLSTALRTAAQASDATGLECLGVLPDVAPGPIDGAGPDIPARRLSEHLGIYRHAVAAPFSRFAETLRNAKVAADIRNLTSPTKVIGVVSALPNEGKSTVAANFAQLMAHGGAKVLLIDADLRNPSLTRSLTPGVRAGLIEVLMGKPLEDVAFTDPVTGLMVLPGATNNKVANSASLVGSASMGALLRDTGRHFDYIVLDLPPMASVVDVRAAGNLIDAFIVVVEWGRTGREILREVLEQNDLVKQRGLGVILNKAHAAMLKRLESYKGRHYSKYYVE